MDRGWHCRGCPKGSILLRAGTLRSTGMGSCIVRAIAPTGDVEPARCSRVHQRPHRRCSGLAGAGRQQAGADGAARRGPRGQEAGGSGSGWTSSRSPVSCREENGVCVGRGPRAGQPGDYRVGVGSTVRAVQETQGLVISGKKMEGKREHLDLPPRAACVAYGSVLRGVFPGRKKRRRRKMFGLLGSLSFPMVQSRSW